MALKRRRPLARAGLSPGDRRFLLFGSTLGAECSFTWKDETGVWQVDLEAAFDAWLLHRSELLGEATERGLIPWAARTFENMPGAISPYEHLVRQLAAGAVGAATTQASVGELDDAGAGGDCPAEGRVRDRPSAENREGPR